MKTSLMIVSSPTDKLEDLQAQIAKGITEPWTVSHTLHTPFSLDEGEQLVVATIEFTPGVYKADINYIFIPLATIDSMRSGELAEIAKTPVAEGSPVVDDSLVIAVDPAAEVTESVEPTDVAAPVVTETPATEAPDGPAPIDG
jgi:hypothetical protein